VDKVRPGTASDAYLTTKEKRKMEAFNRKINRTNHANIPNNFKNGYLDVENHPFNQTGLYSAANSNVKDSRFRYSQLPKSFKKFKSETMESIGGSKLGSSFYYRNTKHGTTEMLKLKIED
jgi:hypothetical protein